MKRRYMKMIVWLSLVVSEITSTTVNAQKWNGNGCYIVRDLDDLESDKGLDEINLNDLFINNHYTYKDLCCFSVDTAIGMQDTWFPIGIYTSVDRAITQVDAVKSEQFYLLVADAKIKDAYCLVDNRPYLMDDFDQLNDIEKNNLAFSLVQEDSKGQEQVVAYINGKDMLTMMCSIKKSEKEKQFIKK